MGDLSETSTYMTMMCATCDTKSLNSKLAKDIITTVY